MLEGRDWGQLAMLSDDRKKELSFWKSKLWKVPRADQKLDEETKSPRVYLHEKIDMDMMGAIEIDADDGNKWRELVGEAKYYFAYN